MPTVEGATGVREVPSPPVAGTDEVQTLNLDATGGTFRLRFQGFETANIAWSSVNATLLSAIDAALEALPSIGVGGIATTAGTLTAGIGTVLLTFSGPNTSKKAQPLIEVANNSLTGTKTCTVVETTPGVNATERGAPKGAQLVDLSTGILYINTGTGQAPIWTKVGLQT
jgi:hypothetical protein